MTNAEVESSLGPWTGDDLANTARANAGVGADALMSEDLRFRSSIAKLVRRRLAEATDELENGVPGVFLLQPSPPVEARPLNPKRVPMLDNGQNVLAGRVWFVSGVACSGYYVQFDNKDDDLLFVFVADTLALSSVPAIVFDPRPRKPILRYYPNGLGQPDNCCEINFSSVEVTIEKVTEVVQDTYDQKMFTSEAQPRPAKLWQDRNKWHPKKDAEDRVQMYLEIALNSAFPTCVIRREQPMPAGRLDIEIIENDPIDRSIVTQHGILELKVLRKYRSTGTEVSDKVTRDWIKSGVEQAATYRDGKEAKWGALFCFDMRTEDVGETKCFQHVKSLANKLEVHLRRWFLYATSKQFRATKAAAQA
ncbi:MAG: hypothetical protein GY791_01895 [Alphaproteobacteria bacterium]|nr:hypothetical protein [Alphaproteobacteria bacterium]